MEFLGYRVIDGNENLAFWRLGVQQEFYGIYRVWDKRVRATQIWGKLSCTNGQ